MRRELKCECGVTVIFEIDAKVRRMETACFRCGKELKVVQEEVVEQPLSVSEVLPERKEIKKRGRPRKSMIEVPGKRKRGRPPKER